MIKYHSTKNKSDLIDFKTAVLTGQAPDKGLYIPTEIPQFSTEFFAWLREEKPDFYEVADRVLNEFLKDEIAPDDLKKLTQAAYQDFALPLEKINSQQYVLRLDRGPTASFKDVAARILARLFNYFLEQEDKTATILVATSGDTGGAIGHAFHNLPRLKVVILFPIDEVSLIQRQQLTTLGGNVSALAIKGKFDNCQAFVKRAFSDEDLKSLNLSAANSINIGRLLPQSTYYFYVYSQLAKSVREQMLFCVPSGNFGNLCGGLLAQWMGLPVYKLIAGVNGNDAVPNFLQTAEYHPVIPSKNCISNAMNIGHPSNLMRLVYWYGGQMDEAGRISQAPDLNKLKNDLWSQSISDADTIQTMQRFYEEHQIVLEPHGAVGYTALSKFITQNELPEHVTAVSLETAHPAKFGETVTKALNCQVDLPETLKGLDQKEEKLAVIESDYDEFKNFLLS